MPTEMHGNAPMKWTVLWYLRLLKKNPKRVKIKQEGKAGSLMWNDTKHHKPFLDPQKLPAGDTA